MVRFARLMARGFCTSEQFRLGVVKVKRRDLIVIFGGAVVSRSISARAQPVKRWRIGFLSGTSAPAIEPSLKAFRQGLRAFGYRDEEIEIEARYADGNFERLPDLAAELVRLAPDVILAVSPPTVTALKRATSTIPVVFAATGDPVGLGLVASLAHPGGNVTGLSTVSQDIAAKWLDLLKTAVPGTKHVGFLLNSANPAYGVVLQGAQQGARSLGMKLLPIDVHVPDELNGAFALMVREHIDGLICWGDPVLLREKNRIVELAASHKLPAIYQFRDFVAVGGLMSYGPDLKDLFRRAATYVDKILRGANPADLPVEQPTRFELVLNLKTAQDLGMTLPQLLLARADEVIE
jgi:putative ABC transport system substrate-binding protein